MIFWCFFFFFFFSWGSGKFHLCLVYLHVFRLGFSKVATCELNLFFCFSRKRKSRSRAVDKTLAKWKENQIHLDSKPIRKIQGIGSKKGCMKGKGGPENS